MSPEIRSAPRGPFASCAAGDTGLKRAGNSACARSVEGEIGRAMEMYRFEEGQWLGEFERRLAACKAGTNESA